MSRFFFFALESDQKSRRENKQKKRQKGLWICMRSSVMLLAWVGKKSLKVTRSKTRKLLTFFFLKTKKKTSFVEILLCCLLFSRQRKNLSLHEVRIWLGEKGKKKKVQEDNFFPPSPPPPRGKFAFRRREREKGNFLFKPPKGGREGLCLLAQTLIGILRKKKKWKMEGETQPAMVVRKMEAQSEYVHVACTFFARLASICMLSRCLLTKFLRRSSVRSLLRVRCWLGEGGWRERREEEEERAYF